MSALEQAWGPTLDLSGKRAGSGPSPSAAGWKHDGDTWSWSDPEQRTSFTVRFTSKDIRGNSNSVGVLEIDVAGKKYRSTTPYFNFRQPFAVAANVYRSLSEGKPLNPRWRVGSHRVEVTGE